MKFLKFHSFIDFFLYKELRRRTRLTIERFPVIDKQGEWQTTLHR